VCGRYNLIADAEALVDFFEIDHVLSEASGLGPRYNIAPVEG
jgi:putative SOS response-associated peptidase YedK